MYTSLGTRFEQVASGHWVWDEVSRLLGVIKVYGVRHLSFCPKECLRDSEDTGPPALQFPLSFHSAAVECCSGRFLRGQLYCSVHKASCCLQPCLVTTLDSSHEPLKHRWKHTGVTSRGQCPRWSHCSLVPQRLVSKLLCLG